jgi:hypothetical protein
MRNPVEGERNSGMIPNGISEPERDSGMMVNTDSAMKPNSFRPIPEPRSAFHEFQALAKSDLLPLMKKLG